MARIVLIGATGLIGSFLAPRLVADGHDLLLLSRRDPGVAGADVRLGESGDWPAMIEGETLEVAISTLGSTRRKAGTWQRFEAIDRHAVVEFAVAARRAGARQMISVSSVGADPESRNPYLALKGRAEKDLEALDFDRLDILRPGLLRGERRGDRRLLERLAILASPVVNRIIPNVLDEYRAIDANRVAGAIASLAGSPGRGRHVYQNKNILALDSKPKQLR